MVFPPRAVDKANPMLPEHVVVNSYYTIPSFICTIRDRSLFMTGGDPGGKQLFPGKFFAAHSARGQNI